MASQKSRFKLNLNLQYGLKLMFKDLKFQFHIQINVNQDIQIHYIYKGLFYIFLSITNIFLKLK